MYTRVLSACPSLEGLSSFRVSLSEVSLQFSIRSSSGIYNNRSETSQIVLRILNAKMLPKCSISTIGSLSYLMQSFKACATYCIQVVIIVRIVPLSITVIFIFPAVEICLHIRGLQTNIHTRVNLHIQGQQTNIHTRVSRHIQGQQTNIRTRDSLHIQGQ